VTADKEKYPNAHPIHTFKRLPTLISGKALSIFDLFMIYTLHAQKQLFRQNKW